MKKKIISVITATLFLVAAALSACTVAQKEPTMPELYINEAGELICEYADGRVKNLGVVKGEDGRDGANGADGLNGKDGKDGLNGADGKDGADANRITIGANGHWYIDGVDTFYTAGGRDSIKVTEETEPLGEYEPAPVTIRNVPQTTKEFDLDNFEIENYYKYASDELAYQIMTTSDVNDIFAYYDLKCRNYDPNLNGLLLVPVTDNISSLTTTYEIKEYAESMQTFYRTLNFNYYIDGYIEVGEAEYKFRIYASSYAINAEQQWAANQWPEINWDSLTRYICAEGDKILAENSYLMASYDMSLLSKPIGSCRACGIYYPKSAENPYEEYISDLCKAFYLRNEYYILEWSFVFEDNFKMTETEVERAIRAVYEKVKDCLVIYDYEHYVHQFDTEEE